MKPLQRDELLIRLDERTAHIAETTESQEKHLINLNSKVAKNILNIDRDHNRISALEVSCTKLIEEGVPLRFSKKQVAGSTTGVVSIIVAIIAGICKAAGLW